MAAAVQLRHSLLAGPVQVPHEASHGSHTLLALAYFPAGVQEARQLPGSSKNGQFVGQFEHSPLPGPWHVAQLS